MESVLNIPYLPKDSENFDQRKHLLDVFPSQKENSPVFLFIHGGGWSAGSKNLYSKLGDNFSKRGITTIIANYRLAPEFNVLDMASDVAGAVQWTLQNAENYNGSLKKFFISGHSAGGHLAALIAFNKMFLEKLEVSDQPFSGLFLIDAFGLNALDFIQAHQSFYINHIENIFTGNPENWKMASPAEYLDNVDIPVYLFTGSETHDVLMYDNKIFSEKLEKFQIPHEHKIFQGKTHMQMILQMENAGNELYNILIDHMKLPA
jgi:acetyl esterase/lipase